MLGNPTRWLVAKCLMGGLGLQGPPSWARQTLHGLPALPFCHWVWATQLTFPRNLTLDTSLDLFNSFQMYLMKALCCDYSDPGILFLANLQFLFLTFLCEVFQYK